MAFAWKHREKSQKIWLRKSKPRPTAATGISWIEFENITAESHLLCTTSYWQVASHHVLCRVIQFKTNFWRVGFRRNLMPQSLLPENKVVGHPPPKLLYPPTIMQADVIQNITSWILVAVKASHLIRLTYFYECGSLILRALSYDIIRTAISQSI
jgi:hypothetical protein